MSRLPSIKPCTHCGSAQATLREDHGMHSVVCPSCTLTGPYKIKRTDAVRSWNALAQACLTGDHPHLSTDDRLVIAFVQGAAWARFDITGFTPFASERDDACDAAIAKLRTGRLGQSMMEIAEARGKERQNEGRTKSDVQL